MSRAAAAEPCVFVVFGGTGDLMRRKLLPALFELAEDKLLPPDTRILGVARDRTMTDALFRDWAQQALVDAGFAGKRKIAQWCRERLHFQPVAAADAAEYQALGRRIDEIEATAHLPPNRVF